ncbi:MAG: selenocysteine-specific translation elongation factor, partial [Candidatus Aquicultorales bacterium]
MRTIVIGTAGHVDHGKTSLVKALTGIETDRLREEKERGISIDIGFAHMRLEDTILAFVDVPGHERFVRNMVCGVSGVDMALLVVAADDGVMPQTREHLDILRLSGVERGLVVLTKVDLVDPETLVLAEVEIAELVRGSFLEGSPVIPFSARTGEGKAKIAGMLSESVRNVPRRPDDRGFRLPIDKVYSVKGYGTVVTGTVVSGSLMLNDEIVVYPAMRGTRARGIQAHHQAASSLEAGQRAGINLAGLEQAVISRGHIVAEPGTLSPCRIVNVRFTALPYYDRPIKNRERFKIYAGTNETTCRVVLMDRETLAPGETAFVQIRAENELVVLPGDRFIVRSLSPVFTAGGGSVLQIHARKYKHFDSCVMNRLEKILDCKPSSILEDAVLSSGYKPIPIEELVPLTGLTASFLEKKAKSLISQGKIVSLDGGFLHHDAIVEASAILEKA